MSIGQSLRNIALELFSIRFLRGFMGSFARTCNSILLFGMYFCVISPIALIWRFFGRRFLDMRLSKSKSYWKKHKDSSPDSLY